MVNLMIHASPKCTDSCLLHEALDCVASDFRDRLRTPVEFVFLTLNNSACDISIMYCQHNGITYNAVDPLQENIHEAKAELDLVNTVLLAIPYVESVEDDDTMKLVDTMLKFRMRVIVLHNYLLTNSRNIRRNLIYYNF